MSDSLFSLVEQSRNVFQIIIENGGELTPEMEAALAEVDIKVPTKIDGYAVTMERLDLESDYWSNKAEQFLKVAKACKTLRERLKDNLKAAAVALDTDELKGLDHRFKISNSTPKLVLDETSLDPAYYMQVTKMEVDKKKIQEDLKLGVPVKGARLEVGKKITPYLNKGGE